ncbi:MAG: hypothetical protein B5M51_07945 [Anaerolinea sp. 4484_236]|nr:MAG: hypothetical protein B5M51_07945 [Anaerolinea sp. 4484_236]
MWMRLSCSLKRRLNARWLLPGMSMAKRSKALARWGWRLSWRERRPGVRRWQSFRGAIFNRKRIRKSLIVMKFKNSFSRILLLMLAATFFSSAFAGSMQANAQGETPPDNVLQLLEEMTPEERVGQLFVVTFEGVDASAESQIVDLIANQHVGGIILRTENDNFTAAPDTVANVYQLIADLQKVEWNDSLILYEDPQTGEQRENIYVPLFVGISQEGGGNPNDQILNGLTPLPNLMAIGATWQPELAAQTGEVLGSELAALGINLYLGPSLDVLELPNPTGSGDMGARVFGGNPFWVGEMGKAFITGLHSGSGNRLLVVAKHFPGRGDSDRLPEEEIATVRKPLEQLKQVELAPFFAVTGNASLSATSDGLLVSHTRYQGFQGNIHATTRPISLDENSLTQILEMAPFSSWREEGGLTISDDLGSRAVREFYAPGEESFSAHLVARDAFLAGNDLLYLGDIISSDSPDTYDTVKRILAFFAQKYSEDPLFAARVDEAVTRILTQKFRIYPYFSLGAVRPSSNNLESVGSGQQIAFDVAQRAATLISPDFQGLDVVLPAPPSLEEHLLFITDTQTAVQCSQCPKQAALDINALPEAILRLYGLGAGDQALEENLASYSFNDLAAISAGGESLFFEAALSQAEWVVISLAGVNKGQIQILRQFFSERQDLLRNKRVILFSFTAPYYLDATDISKMTAYYGLYSYAPPFVDVAARLLYKELTPVGASPVSISGIGYDLDTATQPDPDQLLTLNLALPLEPPPGSEETSATPEPTSIPMFQVGDTLAVRTGAILDHNGHLVPDGTLVVFSLVTGGDSSVGQQIETETVGGVARADFQLNQIGLLDIRVASGEATISETLRLDISDEGIAAAVTIIPPLAEEIEIPTPIVEPTPIEETEIIYIVDGSPRIPAWILVLATLALGAWLAYWAGGRVQSPQSW